MDSQLFVEGYRKSPEQYTSHDEPPEVEELMEEPRLWASFFDRQLFSLLKGASGGTALDIDEQLVNYEYGWIEPFLEESIHESHSLAFFNGIAASAVNELNFHVLNKEFLPVWRHALLPEMYPQLSIEEIEAMQTRLATRGAELKHIKSDAMEWQKIEKTPLGLVAAINGQLTEIDAPIVMLNIMKKYPELLLLPAPPQFESASVSNRSIDYIVIDTERLQSRGLQIKTYIDSIANASKLSKAKTTYKPTRKYDDEFVTLIDGTIDLGNSIVRFSPGNDAILVADPGQISVNFLKDSNNPDIIQAQHNIEGRILHNLYKN